MTPLEGQMLTFLISISAGCLAAFCFDIYKEFTRFFRIRKTALAVGDILFWVFLSLLVFGFLLFSNSGEMRGFMLVGLAMGVAIYVRILGEHACVAISRSFKIARGIVKFTGKMLVGLWLGLTFPVKFVCLLVVWPFRILLMVTGKLVNFVAGIFNPVIPAPVKRIGKGLLSPVKKIKGFLKRR